MMEDEVARLKSALEHAVDVIESYEMDIRNSDWTGVNLIERGFCQGRIYKNAVDRIKRMASGEISTVRISVSWLGATSQVAKGPLMPWKEM